MCIEARIVSDINLTAKDGSELYLSILLEVLVNLGHIVMELLNAVHVAMIGYRHATHTVGYRFVDQVLDWCHTVKDGIL